MPHDISFRQIQQLSWELRKRIEMRVQSTSSLLYADLGIRNRALARSNIFIYSSSAMRLCQSSRRIRVFLSIQIEHLFIRFDVYGEFCRINFPQKITCAWSVGIFTTELIDNQSLMIIQIPVFFFIGNKILQTMGSLRSYGLRRLMIVDLCNCKLPKSKINSHRVIYCIINVNRAKKSKL